MVHLENGTGELLTMLWSEVNLIITCQPSRQPGPGERTWPHKFVSPQKEYE